MESYHSEAAGRPYTPDLRVGSVLKRAWTIFRENPGTAIGVTVLYVLIIFVLSGGEVLGLGPGFQLTGNLLVIILGGPLMVGLYSVMLRLVRREAVTVANLFDGFQHFGRALGVYLLYALATLVGFLLLVIPGFIVMVGLYPALFLVYDERLGVTDTLQRAWELTKGYKWQLLLLGIVAGLIAVLGVIAFIVGVVLTTSYAYVAGAVVYEELSLAAV